MKGEESNSG